MSVPFLLCETTQICSPFRELPTKMQKLIFGWLRVNKAHMLPLSLALLSRCSHQLMRLLWQCPAQATLIQTVYTSYWAVSRPLLKLFLQHLVLNCGKGSCPIRGNRKITQDCLFEWDILCWTDSCQQQLQIKSKYFLSFFFFSLLNEFFYCQTNFTQLALSHPNTKRHVEIMKSSINSRMQDNSLSDVLRLLQLWAVVSYNHELTFNTWIAYSSVMQTGASIESRRLWKISDLWKKQVVN